MYPGSYLQHHSLLSVYRRSVLRWICVYALLPEIPFHARRIGISSL